MDPCNQSQPLPEEVEWEEPQPENIQTGNSSSDQFRRSARKKPRFLFD